VLEEAADDRADADPVAHPLDARRQHAGAADDQVDLRARLPGPDQRLDQRHVGEGVDLHDDACRAAGSSGRADATDVGQHLLVQCEGRLQQGLERPGPAEAGELLEDGVGIAGQVRVGGEEAEVGVEACRRRVVVAGRHLRIAVQPPGLPTRHQDQFGVGLQAHNAVDHLRADSLERSPS
jgi:hypothetical protein